MKKTQLMPELQVTQEYLGHSTHLVYLSPMWEEFLRSDTYQDGEGSTVAKCTDGTIFKQKTAILKGLGISIPSDRRPFNITVYFSNYRFTIISITNSIYFVKY